MGASQQGETKQAQTQAEEPENKTAETAGAPAKDESAAKSDAGDSKAEESKAVEHKNSQTPFKQCGSDAPSAQNVDSKNQPNNDVEGAKKMSLKTLKKKNLQRDLLAKSVL